MQLLPAAVHRKEPTRQKGLKTRSDDNTPRKVSNDFIKQENSI